MTSQGTAAETCRQRSCVESGKGVAASHLQVREARALRRDQQASLLYHCYQYPLRRHVGKPWTKHSAKKDQEARLRSASTAGFFCSLVMETNRRDRQAPNPQASTPISAPLALERKRSLHRRDSAAVFQQAQTTARVHRGGARSRCPHRAEEEALHHRPAHRQASSVEYPTESLPR